jgi:hypothetical protein
MINIDKFTLLLQDFQHNESSGYWTHHSTTRAGALEAKQRWTCNIENKAGAVILAATVHDSESYDTQRATVSFSPANISLHKAEQELAARGFSASLLEAALYRFDLENTRVLKEPAHAYHKVLDIAARKQRTDMRHGSTWYSNSIGKNKAQVCFYDAGQIHKHLPAGACRLEARVQGTALCASYGVNTPKHLQDIDKPQLYRQIVTLKLPHLPKIEHDTQAAGQQILIALWHDVRENTKKRGTCPVKELLALAAVCLPGIDVASIQRIITDGTTDKSQASKYRSKLRSITSRAGRIIAHHNATPHATIAQELLMYIAA